MEIKPQNLKTFLQAAPPAASLFYGVNRGLVRESATRLVAQALGEAKIADAPFGLTRLTAEQVASGAVVLDDAARAISFDMALSGGNRVLWIEGDAEKCATALQGYLKSLAKNAETKTQATATLVAEAGALRKNHKLVQAFAKSREAAVAACYADEGRIQEALIAEYFPANRLPSAVRSDLVARLSPDRMLARRELEKLVLLAGDTEPVTAERVVLAVADNAESDFDDLCYAITAGQSHQVCASFRRLSEGGASPIAVVRIVARHLLRLSEVSAAVAEGADESTALRRLSPPVFWKREAAFRAARKTCPPERLHHALATLLVSETEMKSGGGADAAASLERALLNIARSLRPVLRPTVRN